MRQNEELPELDETNSVVDKAMELFENNEDEQGMAILKQQADTLLVNSIYSGSQDMQATALELYKVLSQFKDSRGSACKLEL
ncbi:MAG: hypothetical protein ACE3L7_07660 [Candidatus Pristimantibacillus sp.]